MKIKQYHINCGGFCLMFKAYSWAQVSSALRVSVSALKSAGSMSAYDPSNQYDIDLTTTSTEDAHERVSQLRGEYLRKQCGKNQTAEETST